MENYRTIKQIADDVGVVRQTIHKYIHTEPLKSLLNDYIKYLGKGNKIYIHIDGVELIRKYLTGDNKDEKDDENNNINDINNIEDEKDKTINNKDEKDQLNDKKDNIEVNKYSKKYIEMLENQIEEKDKLIAELSKSIFNLSQSVNADKQNELVENIKPSLIEAVSSKSNTQQEDNDRGSFLRRLFKGKKKDN